MLAHSLNQHVGKFSNDTVIIISLLTKSLNRSTHGAAGDKFVDNQLHINTAAEVLLVLTPHAMIPVNR